jgi:curved DNA-binding protein CbpA
MGEERKPDYYAVLELRPTATNADIKKAWHEQMQVWHPDRFSHSPALRQKAEARTQLINQAYQTLGDSASRAQYDVTRQSTSMPGTTTTPPVRPSASARGPAPARSRQDPRGPQSLITIARQGQPKSLVQAVHILVDRHELHPYEFQGLVRIAGTISQSLPAGDYAIAEAPDIFCVERRRVEEFNTIFSNPSDNRSRFLKELEPLLAYPHRFLVIEGAIQYHKGGGRLGQYHKTGMMDFLDALTARLGLTIMFTESREEAEERVANLAAMHYAYYFAEQQGYGRCLIEDDL